MKSKQPIRDFKKLHGIETHSCPWIQRVDKDKWDAVHVPSIKALGYEFPENAGIAEYVAKLCLLLDDLGIYVTGKTDADAIRKLCKNIKIEYKL